MLGQAGQHASVVLQGRAAEMAGLGFYPGPLQGKPMRVLAQLGQHREIRAISVIVIDRVQRWLGDRGAGPMLPLPPVVVGVVALDLMSGGGTAPEKLGREVTDSAAVGHARSPLDTRRDPGAPWSILFATNTTLASLRTQSEGLAAERETLAGRRG